jgi:methyltransferase (TIGR00027 family)
MRPGQPSRTAQFVAYNRALGTLAPETPGFSDPVALQFLPENWKKNIARTQQSLARKPRKSPYPFWQRGMGLLTQLRTVVLDRAIQSALPFSQLVILGAGLDSRAWRMAGLENVIVFEVDHPATQAWKLARAAPLPPKVRAVRFVAIDLARQALAAPLQAAGYDPSKPTFWLWEGVTVYLRPAEVSANLAAFAALSVSGSHLAFTYLAKNKGRVPRSLFLAILGEPVRSAWSPLEIAAAAEAHGWIQTTDSGIEDWLPELAPALRLNRRQAGLQRFERIWTGSLNAGALGVLSITDQTPPAA